MSLNPGVPERAAAARAVAEVLQGRTLDHGLDSALSQIAESQSAARTQAMAYGALRGFHRHEQLLKKLLDRPLRPRDIPLKALLSVGLYQLESAARPDYAVVSATVDAARELGLPRAAGLVNAVLRRFIRERHELTILMESNPDTRWSHPGWLVERYRRDWPDDWQSILEESQGHPPMWLRVNRRHGTRQQWLDSLSEDLAQGVSLPAAAADAVALSQPVPVGILPGFEQGRVSVQDLAAQLAVELVGPTAGMRVLDACAAPGGKSAHILEREAGLQELVALDVDEGRTERLTAGLQRLGLRASVICGNALQPDAWWNGESFDRILVDAPCSGTGVIRRHPDIKLLRRSTDIGELAQRQLAILCSLWPLLKIGGRMVYASCSILREENQQVVEAFLQTTQDARIQNAPSWAEEFTRASNPSPGFQILPGTVGADGFYYALMTKSAPGS